VSFLNENQEEEKKLTTIFHKKALSTALFCLLRLPLAFLGFSSCLFSAAAR
jgi:hypothetical protein